MRIIIIFILLSALIKAENYVDVTVSPSALHENYFYLEDKKGELSIDSVLIEDTQKMFRPLNGRSAGFGLTKSDFWIKLSLENPQKYPIKRLLKFDYPLLDNVAFYRSNPDGTYSKKISGDSVAVALHEKKDENILFSLTMQPQSKETLYFHIRSNSSMDLQLYLMSDENYYASQVTKTALLGIFYGGAAIMILYNFFLFLSLRERSYFYYVIFQIANILTLLALSGVAFRYLWPDYPEINNTIIPFLIVLAHVLAIMFTRTFLDTKALLPKQDKVLLFILAFSFVSLFLTTLLDYYYGLILSVIILFITTSSLVTVGLIAYFRYNVRASKFYLIAWILLLIGTTLTGMKNIGLLPINFFTTWGTQIGVFFELLLLSFGLADRINVIRLQKERFQEEAAQKAKILTNVLRKSKEELEGEVKERTEELSLANQELHKSVAIKEALLKEVHHRVKNNLQVIISMMWLQRRRTHNEAVHTLIDDSTARLQSMAVIHEMLYQSHDITMIKLEDYLRSLVDLCRRNTLSESVRIDASFQPLEINLDNAVTMGLICNEVLSNVFKHAFRENQTGNKLFIR
ncbi:MAG: 7TM diverse intracellular signaling domain-containing protein [Sulfuricurvum sp.]|uniref:7TM diverse intracellular signaling domain-containing protein n=1 Tax=Sulfuricurvum sp. TaxID=2025608 RepID=UPI0027325029|nr:7TM diverse intracellular signaling domain-containing protein [Sulfuricurvum sp.]MDP3290619.1 7TM diverse intracellular signaling domain-containing protein [Sulfuricurvum sp.]